MLNIQDLLEYTNQRKSSDLHLVSGLPPAFRTLGDITITTDIPVLTATDVQTLLHSVMSEAQRHLFEQQFELDFTYDLSSTTRFRINAYHTIKGPCAAFRRIETQIRSIDELKLPPILKSLCNLHKGLVLVTGPTGSGKSTTLAAMIDHINTHQKKHILTIEDPVEFIHTAKSSLINQRELHHNTKSFADALRNALREDPDVILVGELRDTETIQLALTASETGHLVFATLHTSSAPKSIDRILDVFPQESKALARTMLASSLQAVITQLLTKTADQTQQVAVHEIMIINSSIQNLIRDNRIAQIYSAMQVGRKAGMLTLEESVNGYVSRGVITVDQAKQLLNDLVQEDNSPSKPYEQPVTTAKPVSPPKTPTESLPPTSGTDSNQF